MNLKIDMGPRDQFEESAAEDFKNIGQAWWQAQEALGKAVKYIEATTVHCISAFERSYIVIQMKLAIPGIEGEYILMISPGMRNGCELLQEEWQWKYFTLPIAKEDVNALTAIIVDEVIAAIVSRVKKSDAALYQVEWALGMELRRESIDLGLRQVAILREKLVEVFSRVKKDGDAVKLTLRPVLSCGTIRGCIAEFGKRNFKVSSEYADKLRVAHDEDPIPPGFSMVLRADGPLPDLVQFAAACAGFVADAEFIPAPVASSETIH